MNTIVVPPMDEQPWPTLGPELCAWYEDNLVHGPGDLLGKPLVLDDEQRGWIYRMYEVEPPYLERRKRQTIVQDKNPRAGKRRFQRCVLSLRKGSRKTELAAVVAAGELHPQAPVRCVGWDKVGGVWQPKGDGITDPYIPMISYAEEQTEELAYGALRRMLLESPLAGDFDIGLERIMRLDGHGRAEAVSASPSARDGARTTFQHADETHRFILEHHRQSWSVMLANMNKRPLADPWAMETTTAPEPGAGSVAESTMDHAIELSTAGAKSRMFFFHREAAAHDLTNDEELRTAIVEASGPMIAAWSDIDGIADTFREPDADLAYLERVWLNRRVQASAKAFNLGRWKGLVRRGFTVPRRAPITIGFDGSRYEDATGLVGTHLETGYQWVLGVWEKPPNLETWEVQVSEVDGIVADAFARYNVVRMYCDPPKWESWVATWAGRYGDKVVVEWWTNRRRQMAYALRGYTGAITAGEVCHDGDQRLERHLGNSCRMHTGLVDEFEKPLWILRKERPDSPHKIDLAMAACLSWEAKTDAVTDGALKKTKSVYESRDPVAVSL